MHKIDISKDELYQKYCVENLTIKKLEKYFGCCQTLIHKKIKTFGIKLRHQKSVNIKRDFFKIWSSNMAYILGFITADGCIYTTKNNYRVHFSANPKDTCLFEFIRESISPDSKFYNYPTFLKKTNKWYPMLRMNINCKEICEDLINLGICQAKTGKETFCRDVPEIYIRDYLRGYFDGDGNVGFYKYKNKSIKYNLQITCASKEFLEHIKDILGYGNINKRGSCYDWRTNSQIDIVKFADFIYDSSGFFLHRKKIIFNYIRDNLVVSKKHYLKNGKK